MTARIGKCKIGEFKKCKKITITSNKKIPIEMHGDPQKAEKKFEFEIIPDALKMRY
jgi:diacylglycerol kinase family enzyme